ncbi:MULTISPECIES: outer membrane protein [unclassified Shimia]|uniref:outer membrane protein n=1 Tax=unclassified Shimia TaxID=2630038 RepID=UPI001AD977F3|nr:MULTISPECIES: outer membrane beta-barrel protein [unclassified Shimia]MBO9473612.1 outer membrane beta-barrel protein [Shimia sp. R10_1]MDA5555184.1 outer membrane beta-barrel protein [Shimia sp. MMG029]
MFTRSLLGATLLATTTLAAPAFAQDWYVQGFLGYSYADDAEHSGNIGGNTQSVLTDLDEDLSYGVSVGRNITSFGNGLSLRGEVELSYRSNDVNAVDFSGNGAGNEANPGGDISATYLLGNLIVDVETSSKFTPYFGGGLGVGFFDQNISYGNGVTIRGDDEVFTAQLIAGTSYEINDQVSLFGDVRYTRGFDVTGTRTSPAGTATVSDDLSNTSLNLGVRFTF